ncbi:MAG: hypothetical protein J6T22_11785 [Bacteroidales bacterium]|nr:hypothetical protein [Bacteroidales bacterium]
MLAITPPPRMEVPLPGLVNAPKKLSILSDVNGCVRFFTNIRQQANVVSLHPGIRSVTLNIAGISEIDLPTTMVLNALGRELGGQRINLSGNFPDDEQCRDFFEKTGFLNDKVNGQGVKFNKSEKTDYFTFNKGQGKLRIEDTIRICKIVRHACEHVGHDEFYDDVVSIIKEIAGNSIEWSKSFRDQWTLGVMFEDNRVTFSILDLGRGILDTIYRKFITKLKGLFNNDIDFLSDVFDKQYSSSSREENRYKGLPSIKKAYIEGKIQNLCVMTNSVLMTFDRPADSIQFSTSRKAFNGTLYFWEINK